METTSETTGKKPKVKSENLENTNINLPEEIITGIISRLPVEHVFQLRCLSRNFSSITNDISFINAHLEHSARLRPSVIINKRNDIYMIQSNMLDSETIVEEVLLCKIINSTDSTATFRIEASCNGLVIFSFGYRDYFIWNPATIQCNRLPNSSYDDGMWFLSVGFGYCTKFGQYKIVRVGCYFDSTDDEECVAEVLSYGTDCEWRRLDFSKFNERCCGPGVTVRGVVYWIVYNDNRLLSFDLGKEEFAWIFCKIGALEGIMEFQGSLAACKMSGNIENSYDICVLKDVGNVDSWETICTTGDIFPSIPRRFLNDHLLILVDEGETRLPNQCEEGKVKRSWSLYDLEREEVKRSPDAFLTNCSEVFDFMESMVPLLP